MSNPKANLHNLKLENSEFTLIFYTSDGNEYQEKGQTLESMHETISDYKKNYPLDGIELYADQEMTKVSITLAYHMPF